MAKQTKTARAKTSKAQSTKKTTAKKPEGKPTTKETKKNTGKKTVAKADSAQKTTSKAKTQSSEKKAPQATNRASTRKTNLKTKKTSSKTAKKPTQAAEQKPVKASDLKSKKTAAAKSTKTVASKVKKAVKDPAKASKTTAEKKVTRKTTAKKEPAAKKATNQPAAAKTTRGQKTASPKSTAVEKNQPPAETTAKGKSALREKLLKKKNGPKTKSVRPPSFTLDEAITIAKSREESKPETNGKSPVPAKAAAKKEIDESSIKVESRNLGAVSVADILGFSPEEELKPVDSIKSVPQKLQKYYKLLLELRDHVVSGLDLHTKDTLKRSAKEDSGNLSAYSQHMADAGTDAFDRDFALSLVSSEQEALHEIEEALKRIKKGTYGTCEITGKTINKERLMAVPFTRFSVEGQKEYEKTHRRSNQRGGAFGDEIGEESVQFMEDGDDS